MTHKRKRSFIFFRDIHRLTQIILLSLCVLCGQWAYPSQRPTVALVLSGGGAKGAAHVGALRVIEQAGIPIDYVVGTSMGALVGGLYSVGYNSDQLDSILQTQDWKVLLSDREDPKTLPLDRRLQNEQYSISIPFRAQNPEINDGGFIQGINIGHLLHQLIAPYNENIDFNSLPIPFACVAVDVVSGKPHVFHSGSLQDAMRASMSIPAVFTPVRKDSMVLVDGGIMNNYPQDVARAMGADIIIGVDVQADLLDAKKLKGVGNVLLQVIDVATNNDYFEKIDDTDIYIKVDVSGYNAASFTTEAIDTLIIRGQEAAQEKWNELLALRHHLDLAGRQQTPPRPDKKIMDLHKSMELENQENYAQSSIQKSFAESSANLSVRYDNIEKVSLLLGLHVKVPTPRRDLFLDLKGRLGNRSFFDSKINWKLHKTYNLCASYKFQNDEIDLYSGRKKFANINYYRHHVHGEALISWRNLYFRAGLAFDHYRWDGLMALSAITSEDISTYSYYIRGHYNSLDDYHFPTKGVTLSTDYQILTSNLLDYHGHTATRVLACHISGAHSLSDRITILPAAAIRLLRHPHNDMFASRNFLGGISDGLIFSGQQTFAGITRLQVAQDALLTTSLSLRGRVGEDQFVTLGSALACQGHYAETLFDDRPSWGVKLGYTYRTLIGPVGASIHYSDISKEVSMLINIGYLF